MQRSVVIVKNEKLAAYIIVDKQNGLEKIRQNLENELPDYMVPSSFTIVEDIPTTINGKIDYRKLPEPEFVDTVEKLNV